MIKMKSELAARLIQHGILMSQATEMKVGDMH